MKKAVSLKKMFALAALLVLFGSKANAQCGAPPTAVPGTLSCYGDTTSVMVLNGLLGGPYNIQPYIDYQFPYIPIGAYAQNYSGSSFTITGQMAGTYTVYVVDIGHGNCYDSAVYTITQPALLNFANSFTSPLTCAGQVQASYTMNGGTAPYSITYTQDGTNFSTLTTTPSSTYTTTLNLGAYAYKLIDANGCEVDQTYNYFGHAPADQSHWYIGMCGVTDSAVSFLTGGNMTLNRNIDLLMLGLGNANDTLQLDVDFGDGSAVQSYVREVVTQMNSIPLSHTYTVNGVYKVTYHAINISNPDTVEVVEFINNNSDVWPGDANGDGVANNFDLLQVGLAFGNSGNFRPGGNNSWTAQPCLDWVQTFSSGQNYKHADCNGDGNVFYPDTTAISLNYGQTHILKLSATDQYYSPTDPTLAVNFPSGNYSTGTPVTIPITLGSSSVPANNFYGIAFTINYPTDVFDANNVSVDYNNSFIGTIGTNALKLEKNFSASGYIDVAVSLNNQTNMSGFGTVCELNIITIDNVSGKLMSNGTRYITISNVRFIDNMGNDLAVNTQKDSVIINTTSGVSGSVAAAEPVIYPNPANDQVVFSSIVTIEEVQITDLSGRTVLSEKTNSKQIQVNTTELATGIYIVRIKNSDGISEKKLEIIR